MRLYLDESVPVVLATLLHQQGVDCRTARDAAHLGATDEQQLMVAARDNRALFTHDTRDFYDWQRSGTPLQKPTRGFCWPTKPPFEN